MSGIYFDVSRLFDAVYVIVVLFSAVMGLGVYIASAIGQMKMSQKCGISNSWLAFIPVVRQYNLGRIAEKYDDGKPTSAKYGKILLALNIATFVLSMMLLFAYTVMIIHLALGTSALYARSDIASPLLLTLAVVTVLVLYVALVIVTCVFYYIALYRVFRIFSDDCAVLFLVLSIFVNISYPVIMLVLSANAPQHLRRDSTTDYIYGGDSL